MLGTLDLKNLASLHDHEEKLRDESLSLLSNDGPLTDHFHLTYEAMNLIYALTHEHCHDSDDQLTIQLLGVRLFNASASSFKLAFSGYYQIAFSQLRDILETSFLLDYLSTHTNEIGAWRNADKRERQRKFGPAAIRRALDSRDGFKKELRKEHYDLLSSHASHATYRGFNVTAMKGIGQVGPFFHASHLQAWMEEATKILGAAAEIYGRYFASTDRRLELIKSDYKNVMSEWMSKHMQL